MTVCMIVSLEKLTLNVPSVLFALSNFFAAVWLDILLVKVFLKSKKKKHVAKSASKL